MMMMFCVFFRGGKDYLFVRYCGLIVLVMIQTCGPAPDSISIVLHNIISIAFQAGHQLAGGLKHVFIFL